MKAKIIKEGEPFILSNGITYTYVIREGKLVLTPVNAATLADKKVNSKFTPPSLQQVKDFFKEKGYKEETAIRAWNHYENGEPKWTDTNGKPVISWKQKMLTNWCKPENKIVEAKQSNPIGENLIELGQNYRK